MSEKRACSHGVYVPFVLAVVLATEGCGSFLGVELGGLVVEQASALLDRLDEPPGERNCTPIPNRCGPSGLGFLAPDCPLGIVCFFPACNHHDICFGTCGASRATCDGAFLQDLMSICTATIPENNRKLVRCASLAYIYWQASVRVGQESFDHAQQYACACENGELKPIAQSVRTDITTPGVPPFKDVDDDLVPDAWEVEVGLDPTDSTDATKDFDRDGLSNLVEFMLGTDPFDPQNPSYSPKSTARTHSNTIVPDMRDFRSR